MIEGIRKSVGMKLAGWRLRKLKQQEIHFTEAISRARSILVVLPLRSTNVEPMKPFIDILPKKFASAKFTFVTPMHGVELIRMLPPGKFIELVETDVSSFFFPRPSFVDRIANPPVDVAIDLNLDFQLPSGYICRKSGAGVTVGFASPYADVFYNLVVRTSPGADQRDMYRRLAACLEMF